MTKRLMLHLAVFILLFSFWQPAPAQAAEPIVRAVLFYSPTCGHCQQVITEVLPPVMEQYKSQFELLAIDISNMSGSALYQTTADFFSLTDDRIGVPTLIIGNTVLVGSGEIPDQLAKLIDQGLAAGGVDWPPVPELLAAIQQYEQTLVQTAQPGATTPATPVPASSPNTPPLQTGQELESPTFAFTLEGMRSAFMNDPVANTVAVIVLVLMLISLVAVGLRYLNGPDEPAAWLSARWIIPVLSTIGLGVALYLSYAEIFGGDVICGPLGKCSSVQESQYAKLFGFLHVGILGAIGYIGILIAWTLSQFGPTSLRAPGTIAVWGMAWFGVLFSIYLTFLEPFVIGATCMWCIASAILMTVILWVSNEQARLVLNDKYDDFEEETVNA